MKTIFNAYWILQALLIAARIAGLISWPWWCWLAPLLLFSALIIVCLLLIGIAQAAISGYYDEEL